MPSEQDPEEQRSEGYAASGLYPNRSPCPVGCKFCYERSLPEFYPNLKVAMIRPKSKKQFDFYTEQVAKYQQSATPASPVLFSEGKVIYHSASDFFAQGLTLEQLDDVVAANEAAGAQPYVSTMGKDFSFEMANHLTQRHPEAFRVRLSMLTFNDEIKGNLIPRWQDSGEIRKMIPILRESHIYLLHFNREQTMKDLREVDALANRSSKPNVGIAVVNYTRLHPELVRKYAEDGFADFEDLVRHLMKHHHELANIGELSFQHPAEGFTFRFRNVVRATLAPFVLSEDDLVLTSRGAHEVLSALVIRSGARVVAVADGLGGSTSFTTTMCTADFRRELTVLLAEPRERPFRRVFVPAPVWWVDQKTRCLGGETVDDLRASFPGVEIIPIEIRDEVLDARLSLRQCYDYYNADLPRTVALIAQGERALPGQLAPLERMTEAGFARVLSIAVDSPFGAQSPLGATFGVEAIAPESLASVDDGMSVQIAYDELLVERSDESFPEDEPGSIRRFRATGEAGEAIRVRRTLVRNFTLADRTARSLFAALFVDKRALADVLAAIAPSDEAQRAAARAIYEALASLELRHARSGQPQ
jgi:hypothetical protein